MTSHTRASQVASAGQPESTMRVRDIMTTPVYTCKVDTPLTAASQRMDQTGCGMLIVLDPHGQPAGILTDRDLAMAVGKSDAKPSHMRADQAMSSRVYTCSPEDSLQVALQRMSEARVRRLPVVTADGDLHGLLSIDDVILWGVKAGGVTQRALARALRSICGAHAPLVEEPEHDEAYEM